MTSTGSPRSRGTRLRTAALCLVCTAMLPVVSSPASAQTLISGGFAHNNVSGGAVASRAAGNMVSAGIARAVDRANDILSRNDIVETQRPLSIRDAFLIDALEIIFDQIAIAIDLLDAVLQARGGE